MMRSTFSSLALALAFIAVPVGTVTGQRVARDTSKTERNETPKTTVEIRNHDFHDAWIWAVRDNGQPYRIGIANGLTTTKLTIPAFLNSGLYSLRFIIDPIGRRGYTRSDEVLVAAGDVVELSIGPF